MAGRLAIDPRPFTIRELFWMCEGRRKHDWELASCIMALIANCHRDSKKKAFKPEQFNPFTQKNKLKNAIPVTKENADTFKNVFMKNFGQTKGKREPQIRVSENFG